MSQRESMQVGEAPTVRVELVGGDLEVRGTDDSRIEIVAMNDGQVSLRQDGELIVITADRGARLRLPRAAELRVVEIRGDLQVRDLETDVKIGRVQGDAELIHTAGAHIDKIGGSFRVRDMQGELGLLGAGGDVRLTDLRGAIRVAMGGDLIAKDVGSPLEATAGGGAVLQIEILGSEPVSVVAGGDIVARLKGSPSAVVSLTSGGSRTIDLPNMVRDDAGPGLITIGEGEAQVTLRAGGDIWLGGADASARKDEVDAIGSRVVASVGKTLAELEVGLAAMGAVMESVPETEISTKVQKIVERAMRRRRRSSLQGHGAAASRGWRGGIFGGSQRRGTDEDPEDGGRRQAQRRGRRKALRGSGGLG